MRTLVWFRGKDLRVHDHPALVDAAKAGDVVPLFVLDPYFFAPERARELPNRIQFLLDSLRHLAAAIERLGSRLLVVEGKSVDVVPRVAAAFKVERVVGHRWTEPVGRKRDKRVTEALSGIPFDLYEGETLARPKEVLTGAGGPFSVYTPFANAFAKVVRVGKPLGAPRSLPPLPPEPKEVKALEVPIPTMEALGLDTNPHVLDGGEVAARARLRAFFRGPGAKYDTLRDRMDLDGTSRLSQDLKFGTLSARTIWTEADEALEEHPAARRTFAREIVWREFAHHVLWHRPDVLKKTFRPEWSGFPYDRKSGGWEAWVKGETGIPIVDAGSRQLLAEGFVPNRARMVTANFLTRQMLTDFRAGEAHYMKFLTDGDWANNDLGWQWSAGCGVDAQPWFRVFNPVLQGQKFDPDGDWVRRWVPELAKLPTKHLHAPWDAPGDVLARAGVVLGKSYARPFIEPSAGRARFLATAEGFLAQARAKA